MKKEPKHHNLSDIVEHMHHLLTDIMTDLEKSSKGNKAASQRVRTGTVKLEKIAKMYRKESILSEKHHTKTKAKGTRKAAPKKAAAKTNAHAKPKTAAKKAPAKAAAKGHPAKAKATVKAKSFAVKRPTAKLPARHR